jgi:hypothetical protein
MQGYRVMATMFFGFVFFGLLHGLCLLPIMLIAAADLQDIHGDCGYYQRLCHALAAPPRHRDGKAWICPQ